MLRLLIQLSNLKIFCLLFCFVLLVSCHNPSQNYLVYIGTYTDKGSEGIYSFRFNPETGAVGPAELAVNTENPSFLAIDPQGKYLYAVNEIDTFNGKSAGAVSVYEIEQSGKLKLQQQVSSQGAGPAHLSLDNAGKFLLVANYNGGNFAIFPVKEDGGLGHFTAFIQDEGSGLDPNRQSEPHAHFIQATMDSRFVMVADLGTDRIMIFKFDASNGSLTPGIPAFIELQPGAGPRHFTFSPSGTSLYVLNELSSSVAVFDFDPATAAYRSRQTISTLPENFEGNNTAAQILVDMEGRFLYASNRGDNSIVQYAIDSDHGELKTVNWTPSGGRTPRNFAIDPTGRWLFAANQDSDNIILFRIDQENGRLTRTSQSMNINSPVCICFNRASALDK
jgi:6-phosphogluconolactonase